MNNNNNNFWGDCRFELQIFFSLLRVRAISLFSDWEIFCIFFLQGEQTDIHEYMTGACIVWCKLTRSGTFKLYPINQHQQYPCMRTEPLCMETARKCSGLLLVLFISRLNCFIVSWLRAVLDHFAKFEGWLQHPALPCSYFHYLSPSSGSAGSHWNGCGVVSGSYVYLCK